MTATASASLERELKAILGPDAVLPGTTRAYLSDATESRNLKGTADAIALPQDANQVAETLKWCYEHDVPVIPRGGGTGFTGGRRPARRWRRTQPGARQQAADTSTPARGGPRPRPA